MNTTRPGHPSGRPVRAAVKPKRSEPVWRCPLTEPATPRLRPSNKPVADAIGYHHLSPEHSYFGLWAAKPT